MSSPGPRCDLRLLILEDDPRRAERLRASFEERQTVYVLESAAGIAAARRRMREQRFDLVLATVLCSDGPAAALAGECEDRDLPLLVMTRPGEEASALGAIAEGAIDQVVISEETVERLPGIVASLLRRWKRERGLLQPVAVEDGEGKSLLDALPFGVVELAGDRRILAINRASAELMGVDPAEVVGRPLEEVLPSAVATALMEGLASSREEGGEAHLTRRFPDPDGGRWSELRFTPLDPESEDGRVVCVEREVTLRKDRDAALELAEARLRALCDALPLDLWFSDPDGHCLLQNERSVLTWGRLVGSEQKGRDSLREGLVQAARRALDGQIVDGEVVVEARGRKSVLKTRVAPVRGEDETLGTLQIAMDRTRERKLELDLKRLEDQMLQTQKMEVMGQLTTGIAHDFKNVLQAIRADVTRAEDLLAESGEDPALQRCLASISDSVERAAGLSSHLLGFTRHRGTRPEPIDLKEMLAGLEGLLTRLIRTEIRLGVYVMSGTKPVRLDRSHLEQILLNLVVNARDAMPSGGDLMIKAWNARPEELTACEKKGVRFRSAVTLSVSDTGCGIPEPLQAKIFDAFFTTKIPEMGTGLGLSTTRSVVQKARGCILLESEPGVGTTFRVVLPASEAEVRRPAPPTQRPVEAPPKPTGPPTILLCEDDDAVRGLMERWLAGLGYRVLSTSSPHRALAMAKDDSSIHLLLTDMNMPEMSGSELRRRMREIRPGLRTLFVTGLDPQDLEPDEDGEFSMLPKPFDSAGLLDAVRELAGEA